MSNHPEVKPWDQLREPKETEKAFNAFQTYLGLGPSRSIDKAFQAIKGNDKGRKQGQKTRAYSYFGQWSKKYNWVERASAYDKEKASELREVFHRRQISELENVADTLQLAVGKLKQKLETEDLPAKDIVSIVRALSLMPSVQLITKGQLEEAEKEDEKPPTNILNIRIAKPEDFEINNEKILATDN